MAEENQAGSAAADAPSGDAGYDSLPGVMEGGENVDLYDAPNGEDGHDPREGEDAFDGEPPPDAPPQQETPPADLPGWKAPDGPVMFNGKQYPSWKAVEDEHKSVVGRLQAQGNDVREARMRAQQYYTLYQQSQSGSPEPPQPGAQPQKPEAPPAFADSLDWEFVNEVLESKGPMGALFYMADEMGKFFNEQLDNRLKDATAPYESLNSQVQSARQASSLFQEAREAQFDEGGAMYPELSDPQASDAILRIWGQVANAMVANGQPREAAFSPVAVDYAVMKYRELNGNSNQSVPQGTPGSESEAAAAALAAGSAPSGGIQDGGAPPRPATRSPEEAAARRVREAGKVNPVFGFAE